MTTPTPIQSIASPVVAANYYETPFIYAKNIVQLSTSASPITGPTGAYNDVVRSQGDSDFFARRALACLNFLDMNQQAFISGIGNQTLGSFIGLDMPLAPEKLYTLGSDIPFQLQQNHGQITNNVAFMTFPGGTTAFAQIACPMFFGVKRRNGAPDNKPNYRFSEADYSYVLNFTQNWTYLQAPFTNLVVAAPRTFIKTVLNYDFELQALEFSAFFNNANSGQESYNGYMIKLYDANGIALMSDYVPITYLSRNGGFSGSSARPVGTPGSNLPWWPNAFPCPPVLYPKGSNIQMDVISLLDTSGTGGGSSIAQTVHFSGVNRIPC